MKIAYIVLAHKLPEQTVRLVRRLNSTDSLFFIHVDKKSSNEIYRRIFSPLSEFKNVYFLDRMAHYYGDFNHVEATLIGIRKLFALGLSYDYVFLLTGQDYPIKSNSVIQKTLQESGGMSFIEYFSLPDNRWADENGGLDRLDFYHLHWFGWEFPFLKKTRHFKFVPDKVWSALEKVLPFRRPFPQNLAKFGGSSYWCLSRECIEYIYEFTQREKAFVKFFKHAQISDELFFQTILMNSPLKDRIINDNLRYIVWSTTRHPALLRTQDFEQLMSSKKLIARKFDPTVDPDILDLIDQAIAE